MISNEAILEEARRTLARLRPAKAAWAKWVEDNVAQPLLDMLEGLAEAAAGLFGTIGGKVLLGALVLAGLLLLFLVGRILFRRGQSRAGALASDRVARSAPLLRDPDDADREAEGLAREGRFREAVRLTYLATFVRLHRRSGRPFDPTLTPRENLRPFRAEPWFPGLRTFVAGYLAASFGDAPLDGERYRALADLRPPEGAA